jgi:hypothetical protein
VPFPRAGVRVNREERAGIEVVSLPIPSIEVGPWIARRPVEQVQLRIVGPAEPGGRAAPFELSRPRFRARFAFRGNRVEPPELVAVRRGESRHIATHAGVATGDPHDDFVLDGERSRCRVQSFFDVPVFFHPEHAAVPAVERDEMHVARDEEDGIPQDGRATIGVFSLRLRVPVLPDQSPGPRIQGAHLVAVGDVHDSVMDDRAGPQPVRVGHVIHPFRRQPACVGRRDLGQRTVPSAGIVAGICQPVVGGTLQEVFVPHLSQQRCAQDRNHHGDQSEHRLLLR